MPHASQKNKATKQSQLIDVADDANGQSSSSQNKLSKNELERKVNEMLRYILFNDKKKVGIKRADLVKNVMKEQSRAYASVMKEVATRLQEVFGFELVEMETIDGKSRGYILINKIDKLLEDEISTLLDTNEETNKMGLLLIIVSLIFMNEGPISDVSLWHTLGKFGVYKDREHEVFGNVEKLLNIDFVRQNYLERQKVQGNEGPSWQYNCGLRSWKEISKRKILEFVSEIYGVDSIEDWKIQYQQVIESEQEQMDVS